MNERVRKRLERQVERRESGCTDWIGTLDRYGYGRVSFQNRKLSAHRLSWMLNFGVIPPGFCVLHLCDNPACVEPTHLTLGTQLANIFDRDKKGRGVVPVRAGGRWTGRMSPALAPQARMAKKEASK